MPTPQEPLPAPRLQSAVWLVTYFATMSLMIWLLVQARQRVVESLGNPAAKAQWQQWKDDVRKQQADPNSPTRRREPGGNEPPGLVLMRDHFPVVVGISLVIGTILFGFLALVVRGMLAHSLRPRPLVAPGP